MVKPHAPGHGFEPGGLARDVRVDGFHARGQVVFKDEVFEFIRNFGAGQGDAYDVTDGKFRGGSPDAVFAFLFVEAGDLESFFGQAGVFAGFGQGFGFDGDVDAAFSGAEGGADVAEVAAGVFGADAGAAVAEGECLSVAEGEARGGAFGGFESEVFGEGDEGPAALPGGVVAVVMAA